MLSHVIRQSQERYRATFGRAGIGIAHNALDGRWLDANPAYCELVGYTRAELITMRFQDITYPDDVDPDVSSFARLIANEITEYSMTKRYVHKRGQLVWIDLTVTLVRPENEAPYAVAIARDATAGRRELIETQRERDAFFELSLEALVIIEFRDGEPWFRRANPAMCTLLQYPEEHLKSRPIYAWVYPEDMEHTRQALELLDEGSPQPCENRYVTRDGRIRWLSWSLSFVDGLYYCVARDVTADRDRARLEAEQQRRLTAASKLNALGRMAANISHEIKNPLAVIYGNACQLEQVLGPKVPDACVRMINEMQSMSMRIVKIIDGLRGFSREASRDAFETVSLKQLFSDTLSFCESRLAIDSTAAAPLEFRCQPVTEDIFLRCQPVQLQQVLLNLLTNALDATMSISKLTKRIGIRHRADAQCVHICVYDNGDGIPADVRPHLFEPFFTTKQVGKGTGLGLSIAHEIAISHRGRLYLDPNADHTTFVVELPRAYPSPPGTS